MEVDGDSKILTEAPSSRAKQIKEISERFKHEFGQEPLFYSHAPGRVNIIGEHIDYCGYSVLPMALEQDVLIAVGKNSDNVLRLRNVDCKYKNFECPSDAIDIDKSNPQWQHYFLCGYKGILEHFGMEGSEGLNLLVDGRVQPSAGLSSSSAFVCSAALATMHAYSKSLKRLELAHICQHCEYYIGTEGGGMDQCISFLAEAGKAKLIEFNPIRATDVTLPEGATFLISNSWTEINKAATNHFNTRVAECRLATQVLAKSQGLDWRQFRKLGELQAKLGVTLSDMLGLVSTVLHREPYSKREVCELLGVSTEELDSISLSERTYAVESFKLWSRASHVYSEAERVLRFKAVCEEGEQYLQQLGQLMFDSHASCSQLYECSSPQLDQLVALAKERLALSSRLTCTGWGGCVVSLVPSERVHSFVTSLKLQVSWGTSGSRGQSGALGSRLTGAVRSGCVVSLLLCDSVHSFVTSLKLQQESGALGSRLTGAGWGGCVVSLVPSECVDSFVNNLKQGFYAKTEERMQRVEQALFVTQPGGGAGIYLPTSNS